VLTSDVIDLIIGSPVQCTHRESQAVTSDPPDCTHYRQRAHLIRGEQSLRTFAFELIDQIYAMTNAASNPAFNSRGPRAGSFNAAVGGLSPGECISKVREVDPTMTVARLPDEMPAIRSQLRNACAPSVARAKEITGGTYTCEVGDVVMPGGSMYVIAVIKRID
jgi:hypothetical protein